jgi:hypothetical protein
MSYGMENLRIVFGVEGYVMFSQGSYRQHGWNLQLAYP